MVVEVPFVSLVDLYINGGGPYQAHVTVRLKGHDRRAGGNERTLIAALFAALRNATQQQVTLYSFSIGSGRCSPDGSIEKSLADVTVGLQDEFGNKELVCSEHADTLHAAALAYCKALTLLDIKRHESMTAAAA